MPHDFGSSRDRRSASPLGAGIGFHELRQACEISALREDLERLAHEAGALREGVEQAVESVRDRFAALSAEEMADPMVLAPLLQLAVTTLLDIREQARQLNTQAGPLSDDERPSWLGAADAPRLRQPAAAVWDDPADHRSDGEEDGDDRETEVDPVPNPTLPDALPKRLGGSPVHAGHKAMAAPLLPDDRSATKAEFRSSDAPIPEEPASWLAGEPAPSPSQSRAASVRANGGKQRPPGGIDWLGPAGR